MASIVFYFQVHQPWRLRRYSVFDSDPFYFDNIANRDILLKVADKCYRPATTLMLDLVKKNKGNFRISYSITGTVLDQLEQWAPDVLDLFKQLGDTGCCEFIAETDYHSLSFIYSREEFRAQIEQHTQRMERLFGQRPTVFRNTELTYNNDVAHFIGGMKNADGSARFKGMLCEGVDRILGYRSPNFVYRPPGVGVGAAKGKDGAARPFGLLLKNYRLSDDIAFRFGNRGWEEWPLSTEKFARWVHQINGDGYLCNLFMDYETFGEHQWADTGIFDFLGDLPRAIFDIARGENHFITPSEAFEQFEPVGEYDVPHMISWADTERDLSAWLGNAMQVNAITECYKLERPIKDRLRIAQADDQGQVAEELGYILEDWRKLTTSDHFYYMCTKWFADGDVHKYFNPYDSPYDSYINFMNVLDNLRERLDRLPAGASARPVSGAAT
ncbi:MAG: glycoside hydrolase family 57 protein [Phycisphaerales bacterium]|nr:glycoside hydrolase family 57 protein [Phycisphaerales bacterium]